MKLIKLLTSYSLLLVAASLHGATVVQSDDFSHTESFATPGRFAVMPDDFLLTTFQPFDANLGTLESFTIAWTLKVQWDYVIGDGGNHSVSGGVTAYINDIGYTGTGGGNGHSFPGSGTLEINPNTSVTHHVSEITGGTGAALYDIVTGTDPFTSLYDSSIAADLTGEASVAVRVTGSSTLTYVYSSVPEPAAFGLIAGLGAAACLLVRRSPRKSAPGGVG